MIQLQQSIFLLLIINNLPSALIVLIIIINCMAWFVLVDENNVHLQDTRVIKLR